MTTNNDTEFIKMVADHMENGFLENIIDMFKYDAALYEILPHLISDERIVVRIGTTALIESLNETDKENVTRAIPHLISLLKDEDPNIRGDSVSLLGLIANVDITEEIKLLLDDDNPNVKLLAEEAIEEIRERLSI
jgi:HEAT repeat protein